MSLKQLSFFFCLLLLISCENNEQTQECIDNPINFISLTVENDTIEAGISTFVTAVAEGYEISYEWSATRGYITPVEGKPYVIKYSASPCAVGEITVTCKVTDYCNNSKSRDVKIMVI